MFDSKWLSFNGINGYNGSMTTSILQFTSVDKSYRVSDRNTRHVLRDISFAIAPGRTVALVGRSGSGKSTLLHLAAGIDVPSAGRVHLAGHDLGALDEAARTTVRRDSVGFIFQFFHLLLHLSVRDNVALPGWIAGLGGSDIEARSDDLLARVELADRRDETVQKLSGGEMQRVAICRALLRRPRLILADEPTGSLDEENGQVVMDLLRRLTQEEEATLLYVTHSEELAGAADAVWRLQDGRLQGGDDQQGGDQQSDDHIGARP